MKMDADTLAVCKEAAKKWNVFAQVHPEDHIFRFLYENTSFATKEQAIHYYFDDGANSSKQLLHLVQDICKFGDKPFELLEFASGYGCVTRHLRNLSSIVATTACDIHPEAVRFINDELRGDAVLSDRCPEKLHFSKTFDIVFALSFFSHMPEHSFTRWLKALFSFVKPGGFLIFTTHGLASMANFSDMPAFNREGFAFLPSSEQKDLDVQEYGQTIVKPHYVLARLFELPAMTLKFFHAGRWWGHQDLYVVQRQSAPPH